jgi:hypothetical protein
LKQPGEAASPAVEIDGGSGVAEATAAPVSSRRPVSILANMALHDWVIVTFLLYILARLFAAPDSPGAEFGRRLMLFLFTVAVSTIVLARGELVRSRRVRAVLYRIGIYAPPVLSYFAMRTVLPALSLPLVDSQLHAIDDVIFGVTPSLWLAQFNTRNVTEWFAFFYWSYFIILGVMTIPALFFGRGRRVIELLLGAMLVACIGHVGYTLVPGYGPYATIEFSAPIDGGLFWGMVWETVSEAGALIDIFPSLHTAFPTYFAIHAFANRDFPPYKYGWPVLAFFAANIIVATMFLRWHWGIDVVFGLLLAFTAYQVSAWVAPGEAKRGVDGDDRQPVWESIR